MHFCRSSFAGRNKENQLGLELVFFVFKGRRKQIDLLVLNSNFQLVELIFLKEKRKQIDLAHVSSSSYLFI